MYNAAAAHERSIAAPAGQRFSHAPNVISTFTPLARRAYYIHTELMCTDDDAQLPCDSENQHERQFNDYENAFLTLFMLIRLSHRRFESVYPRQFTAQHKKKQASSLNKYTNNRESNELPLSMLSSALLRGGGTMSSVHEYEPSTQLNRPHFFSIRARNFVFIHSSLESSSFLLFSFSNISYKEIKIK